MIIIKKDDNSETLEKKNFLITTTLTKSKTLKHKKVKHNRDKVVIYYIKKKLFRGYWPLSIPIN